MAFWETEESSNWQEDSLCSELHTSLFETQKRKMKSQRSKKRKSTDANDVTSESKVQASKTAEGDTVNQNIGSKRKRKEETPQPGQQMQLPKKGNDASINVDRSISEKSNNRLSCPKEKEKHPIISQDENETDNKIIENVDSGAVKSQVATLTEKASKKRKSLARSNKFKPATTSPDETSRTTDDVGKATSIKDRFSSSQQKKKHQITSQEENEAESRIIENVDSGAEKSQVAITEKAPKKRKRNARNNKFKPTTTSPDKPSGTTDDLSNGLDEEHGTQNGIPSSEPAVKLSRKERRKLKNKLAKKQLGKSNDCDASTSKVHAVERTMSENGKTSKRKVTKKGESSHESMSDEETVESHKEVRDTHCDSKTDQGSDLILVKSNKKTSLGRSDADLKTQMESQLKSSQFRFLNERLYKVTGAEAKVMFAGDGVAFQTYHEGFTQQVQQWPVNPVDAVIKDLKKTPASLIVGDFGCGDAKIARSVKQKVHSFDLYPINKHVTVCDVKKVPLKDGVLDVGVFCLALMGTNWMDYLKEANRVLKTGGLLKVAEVASRFTSLASFLSVMKSLGFHLKFKDVSNKMFYLFDFRKKQGVGKGEGGAGRGAILKPCLYKKR